MSSDPAQGQGRPVLSAFTALNEAHEGDMLQHLASVAAINHHANAMNTHFTPPLSHQQEQQQHQQQYANGLPGCETMERKAYTPPGTTITHHSSMGTGDSRESGLASVATLQGSSRPFLHPIDSATASLEQVKNGVILETHHPFNPMGSTQLPPLSSITNLARLHSHHGTSVPSMHWPTPSPPLRRHLYPISNHIRRMNHLSSPPVERIMHPNLRAMQQQESQLSISEIIQYPQSMMREEARLVLNQQLLHYNNTPNNSSNSSLEVMRPNTTSWSSDGMLARTASFPNWTGPTTPLVSHFYTHPQQSQSNHSINSSTSAGSTSLHEFHIQELQLDDTPAQLPIQPSNSNSQAPVQVQGQRKSRTRHRVLASERQVLLSAYESHQGYPSRRVRERLAQKLNLTLHTVTVWFQNERQRVRRAVLQEKQTSSGETETTTTTGELEVETNEITNEATLQDETHSNEASNETTDSVVVVRPIPRRAHSAGPLLMDRQ